MATFNDASSTRQSGPPPIDNGAARGKLVEYEQFIESQLRKTRSHVRTVDLAGSLMALVAGTLGYFLLAGIVDHWIVSGGLGFWGRLLFLAGYAAAALYYLFAYVAPLLLRRINPLYAAHAIERSRPSLKNGLLNFLFFRADPGRLPPVVYQAIEEQAATNLAKVHVEGAVDRSKLIKIGYALVAVLFVCALYTLLSPKDLIKTVGRVVMPWADISPPTRTAIVEIEPGDARAFRGQQVTVAAHVGGLSGGGKVTLLYSTADGQIVDRAVEMNLPPDGYKHACVLPAADASLQQSLSYRIAAGDAVTRTYRIEVVAAPTIVVQSVAYKYPSYTGLLSQRVEHQGDIKAIEGTEVTIEALANQDIVSAGIDFDCEGRVDLRMQADKQQATATLRLALKDDRQTPEHASYQVVFKNAQGQQNPQPVRHQIEVTPDLAPEIQFVAPKNDEIDLAANGVANLELVANDPDFALRMVKLSAATGKQPLFDKLLLDEAWRGQLVKKFRFEPRKLGLKAGDVVEYWAMAEDNKDPRPNRTQTGKRRIRIVSPSEQTQQDQVAQNKQQGGGQQQPEKDGGQADPDGPRDPDQPREQDRRDEQPPRQGQKADKSDERGHDDPDAEHTGAQRDEQDQRADEQAGQRRDKDDERQTGTKAEQRQRGKQDEDRDQAVPNDGSDDASAIEQILNHRDEQDKSKSKSPGTKRPDSQGRQQASSDKRPPGEKKPSDEDQPAGQNQQDAQQQDQSPAQSPQRKPQQGDKQDGGQQPTGQDAKDEQKPERGRAAEQDRERRQPDGSPGSNDEQKAEQPGGEEGAEKGEQKPERRSKPKPDESDRSQGKSEQKGAGAGDNGAGNDSGGGQQGPQGQAGSKGQSNRSPSQGQGQGKNPGDPGDNRSGQQQNSKNNGKGSKAGGSKPGNDDRANDGSQQAEGAEKDKGHAGERPSGKENEQAADRQGQKSAGSKQGSKPDAGGAQRGDKDHADGQQRGENDTAEDKGGETPDAKSPSDNSKQGQGDKSKGDAQRERDRQSSPDKPNADAQGGDNEKEKGDSGAGQRGKDNKGSPSPQQQNQGRSKSPRPSDNEKDSKPGDEAQSPSTSQKESDSEGLDDGDRSGGGKQGGGQKANKSGTGGAGQNTAADEGAGQSDEPGKGETSNRAGRDRNAGKQTGRGGSQPGEGSSTSPSGGSDKSGPGKPAPGDAAPSNSAQPSDRESQQDQVGSQPGGTPGNGVPGQPPNPTKGKWAPGNDQADEANLEYARKATDLALAHLKDELRKDKPDPELLNRLGWSKQDLENFVKRWEQMRKGAQAPGEQGAGARRELDETLRSLGLRPRSTSLKSRSTRDDQLQGVRESRHTAPPPEYREQTQAYSRETARDGNK